MTERLIKERKFWDSFAQKYDRNKQNNSRRAYETLFKLILKDVAGAIKLLETATGTGLISLELSNVVPLITATDLSPEMLKIARKKAQDKAITNVDFIEGDICKLDFKKNTFDAVIASNVLHLLFTPEKAVQELKRAVKIDGIVIIPTYCHGENLLSHFISRCMTLVGFRARWRWSVSSFQKFIQDNGFEIVKTEVLKGVIPMAYLVAKPKIISN